MCCFSRPVIHVSRTRIFARAYEARQALAYQMAVTAEGELAMVLPLPVPPSAPEDAVRFLDLSSYRRFFDDVELAFPAPPSAVAMSGATGRAAAPQVKLKVHEVGDFEASFVPRARDLQR